MERCQVEINRFLPKPNVHGVEYLQKKKNIRDCAFEKACSPSFFVSLCHSSCIFFRLFSVAASILLRVFQFLFLFSIFILLRSIAVRRRRRQEHIRFHLDFARSGQVPTLGWTRILPEAHIEVAFICRAYGNLTMFDLTRITTERNPRSFYAWNGRVARYQCHLGLFRFQWFFDP